MNLSFARPLMLLLTCVCVTLAGQNPVRAEPFAQQLNRWLDEPDVKLVAVELYADWCEPCKAAAPRWEALRKRYAHKGLKLVVVNIDRSESDQRCGALPWRPDVSLCDPGIARELGVGGQIPQAFVWSWQGNLLVDRGGHVDEIEAVIRSYLDHNPRVLVEASGLDGKANRELKRQIESALGQDGKITLVTDTEERRRLQELQRQTHSPDRREDQRCALGQEISPNLFLRAERFPGSLSLSLQSLESQCNRPVSAPWNDDNPQQSVRKAVFSLKSRMVHRPAKMPSSSNGKTDIIQGRHLNDDGPKWTADSGGEVSVIRFETTPPGATVLVDDRPVCQTTPCSRALRAGPHKLTLVLANHQNHYQTLKVVGDDTVMFTLTGDTARLNLETTPPGLRVLVDGQEVGTSPLREHLVSSGPHRVVVQHPCYLEARAEFSAEQGETHALSFAPEPRPAGLRIRAVNARGDDVRARVLVDDRMVGESPGTFTVGVCSTRVEVRNQTDGMGTAPLNLVEQKITDIEVSLTNSRSAEALVWTLLWDFRQTIWALPEEVVRRYETACGAGDPLACHYRVWHRPTGALLDAAFGPMSTACEAGNPVGCLVAGWAMTQEQGGWGEPTNAGPDPPLGYSLVKRGCELGLDRACIELGRLYDRGVGTLRRRRQAADLYKKACDKGNARGCNNLAAMHIEGLGISQDTDKALKLYRHACEAQNPLACFNLAQHLRAGRHIPEDSEQSTSLYIRACRMGNALACQNAGVMYEDGKGVERNLKHAGAYYEVGCSGGHAPCCKALKRLRRQTTKRLHKKRTE